MTHMAFSLVQTYNYILRQCKEFDYVWSYRLFMVAKSKGRLMNYTQQNVKNPVVHVKVKGTW